MLSRRCVFEDLDPVHWGRLSDLSLAAAKPRRLFVVHEAGRVVRCHDTAVGDRPLPCAEVADAQACADALLAERSSEGVAEVWVLDLDAFHERMSAAAEGFDGRGPLSALRAAEWAQRHSEKACAVAPRTEFLHFGLPWARLERFVQRMLPPRCVYVLGVFDGDALWASLLARFEGGEITGLSTAAALPPEELRDIVGLDQHPFMLAAVANRYRMPAFGWFCGRTDFEAYLKAPTVAEKDSVFQRALMDRRATFDFQALVDRGLTVLGPINPGEAAVAGVEREANPRTRTPDPDAPVPDPFAVD